MSRRTFRPIHLLAGLVALGLASGCAAAPEVGQASVAGPASQRARAASPFWVDPDSPAARQVHGWRQQGRTADAETLERIAGQPVALWPAGETDPGPQIRAAAGAARRADRTLLLTAYNIPHRDCGQHSAGGAADADAYRDWIERFAAAIGDTEALVVLEPDAIAHVISGCTPVELEPEREALLREAVARLTRQPHTRVYLDAGNPAWIKEPWKLADPLRRAGVADADGFALNVANFQTDAVATAYARELSKALGGRHFVIDTSRNGRGPLDGVWCNPPGRALGTRPTTDTGVPGLDAYLWIKRPGESDGDCEGGPQAGRWWPEYALELARNSGAQG
ncbi:glycoside hydrolase family 6 protein [Streptomyces sp. NPDC048290]|uniref:glycoside hydrolase family 6 protein n=1 Tax=Streptomyces sp. NPDC048290 TaxID=3155811 RepID=UPI0034388217